MTTTPINIQPETSSDQRQLSKPSAILRFWNWVSSPSTNVQEIGDRRLAQLLAALALVLLITLSVGLASSLIARGGFESGSVALLALSILTLVVYILARTRYFKTGAWIFVWSLAFTGFILAFRSDTPLLSLYTTIPLAYVLGSILLPVPVMSALVVVTVGISFALPTIAPQIFRMEELGIGVGNLMTLGILLSIAAGFRELVERDRLSEIKEANRKLQAFSATLEQRVMDRTRDLSLAGEVGRVLSQERDLDRLLKTAVEFIRSTYSLYYTQLFLLDPGRRSLVLRSGTGEVGLELLRRGHRLEVGLGSINGSVALQRSPVIVSDTVTSNIFRPNPLLPETRSELAIPLLAGDLLLGVLDMQSSTPATFSEENMAIYEALAGQLAIAIENAELLERTNQARFELEQRARRQTRSGWDEYLNAIERGERIGFRFNQSEMEPLVEPLELKRVPDEHVLSAPIIISGEPVGLLQVEHLAGEVWGEYEAELVNLVAVQVARRVDNLRLLSQAKMFRQEAETSARRLAHEGWQSYIQINPVGEISYKYDHLRVSPDESEPINDNQLQVEKAGMQFPLAIGGATIGELSMSGLEVLDESQEILCKEVTERLSEHLETLRLADEARRRNEDLSMINRITGAISQTMEMDAILRETLQQLLSAIQFESGVITLGNPLTRRISLAVHVNMPDQMITNFQLNGMDGTPCDLVYQTGETIYIQDLDQFINGPLPDPRAGVFENLLQKGFLSYVGVPLESKGISLGTVCTFHRSPTHIPPERIELLRNIGQQVGVVVDNARLFERTQSALSETERLYEIIADMNTAQSYQDILQAFTGRTLLRQTDLRLMCIFDRPLTPGAQMGNLPEWIYPVSVDGSQSVEIARKYPVSAFQVAPNTLFTEQPVMVHDVAADKRLDAVARTLFQEVFQASSMLVLPFMLADECIGFLMGFFKNLTDLTVDELQPLQAIAGQAAIAVQSRLLLEQAEARARQEQRLREVSSQVFGAADVNTIMRRAVEQVGKALKAPAYIYLGAGEKGKVAGARKTPGVDTERADETLWQRNAGKGDGD